MRKSHKLTLITLLLAVIILSAAAPTLSWLSSTSAPVVNTFAGGMISIQLDEALVDTDGKAVTGAGARRVTANRYKYSAGAMLDKDPTPKVLKGSEECYVFLCVENGLGEKFSMNYDTAAWLKIAEMEGTAVYIYSQKVMAAESENDLVLKPIFTTVTVSSDLTAEDIAALGEKTLTLTAYAVQTGALSSREAIDLAVAQFLPGGAALDYPAVA